MWLATTRGFYSVVAHRDLDDHVLIRARAKRDLRNLVALLPKPRPRIQTTMTRADYPYRVAMRKADWMKCMVQLADDVDYDNFKNAVRSRKRHDVYSQMWGIALKIEREDPGVRRYLEEREERLSATRRTRGRSWFDRPDPPTMTPTLFIPNPNTDEPCAECGEPWFDCLCPREDE